MTGELYHVGFFFGRGPLTIDIATYADNHIFLQDHLTSVLNIQINCIFLK